MKSHREIFRSSAIIGGSTAVSLGIGIIRVKLLAVLLGPAGIGVFGILGNILGLATKVSGSGLSNSGVRQLALSAEDHATLASVRHALLLANAVLGCLGMSVIWLLRDPISQSVFDGAIDPGDVGWLGLGVLLSLMASSQTTLLQGMRRIGDLASVQVLGALLGTLVGVTFVFLLGQAGIVWMILVGPAVSIVVASYFTRRLPRPKVDPDWREITQQCHSMIRFGFPVMLGGLMNIGTELLVRALIARDLGIEAAGHFQASWAISMTYVGLVLGAMAADYYPRLTAAYSDPRKARRLVNEQAEMALLLGGPVILALISVAPLAIYVLYSREFEPAAEVLRWQMLGSILKFIGWPMGFVVLASGRSVLFVYTQFVWNAVFLLCLYFMLDGMGLKAIGVGFCIAYLVSVANIWFVTNRLIGMVPTRFNLVYTGCLVVVGGLVVYLSAIPFPYEAVVGCVLTALVAIYSWRRLNRLVGPFKLTGRRDG